MGVRTRWCCGEISFPHSAVFLCVSVANGRGAYYDKACRYIIGWLVGWSLVRHVRELELTVCHTPIVTIEH